MSEKEEKVLYTGSDTEGGMITANRDDLADAG